MHIIILVEINTKWHSRRRFAPTDKHLSRHKVAKRKRTEIKSQFFILLVSKVSDLIVLFFIVYSSLSSSFSFGFSRKKVLSLLSSSIILICSCLSLKKSRNRGVKSTAGLFQLALLNV